MSDDAVSFKHCKNCGILKKRILVGKYPDGKNNKYVDQDGHLWNGRRCSQCQAENAKKKMKELRFRKAITEKVEANVTE